MPKVLFLFFLKFKDYDSSGWDNKANLIYSKENKKKLILVIVVFI